MAHRSTRVEGQAALSLHLSWRLQLSFRFQRYRIWLRTSWHILLLLALPVLLLSPSLFGGRAVTADDLLLYWAPWSSDLASYHFVPQNILLPDGPLEIDSWLLFTHQELAAGRFPFWNPTVAGGTPFFAAEPAVLYPLTWLEALFPYPLGLTLGGLLRWWLVGLGMYVFARSSLKLARTPALIPALSFMLGSFWVVWFVHLLSWAVMLLPWLMWATERAIRQPSARRVGVLALVVSLIGLSGHPEMSFHVMLGAGLYALWLGAPIKRATWRARLSGLGCWGGGVALGLALAAVQMLPTLAILLTSLAATMRGSGPPHPYIPLSGLLTWIVPNIGGNPAFHTTYWGPLNYNEAVYFAGGVTLILAVLALGALRSPALRNDVAFFAGEILIIGGLLYGLPPFAWLAYLPGLNADVWERLNVLVIFSVGCLGGIGLEYLETWRRRERPAAARTRRRFIAWLVAWVGVLLAALGLLAALAITYASPSKTWIALWAALALVGLWGSGLILVCYRDGWLKWQKAQFVLLALLLVDLLLFAAPYIPQSPTSLAYPETSTIMRLQKTIGSARMAASGWLLPPDSATPYALHDLRAYDPLASSRYRQYMLALDPSLNQGAIICCQTLTCPSLALLSVASVDYYATFPDVDANRCATLTPGQAVTSGPLIPLWTQGGITLWRNTWARPRFYFADTVIASRSEQQTLAALPTLSADGREAIIEGASPAISALPPDAGTISVLADLPGEITLRIQHAVAGWLVVNEGYDAGWRADVDGVSTAVHPANEMFQAVFVPAGAHTVHLVYRPVFFVSGAWLSALALLGLLWLLLGSWIVRILRIRCTKFAM